MRELLHREYRNRRAFQNYLGFYAGYKRRGLLAIILTATVFGLVFSILMAFYDIITVTNDAAGVRFKE